MEDLTDKPIIVSQENELMENQFNGNTPDDYKEHYAEFIETAAHDLQAPLRKLTVLVERLTGKFPVADREVENYTSRINTCLRDMRLLIDDMSEMAALTPQSVEKTSCDLDAIVGSIRAEFNKWIQERNGQVTVSDLPIIQADQNQCRQLFKKLIRNALLFHDSNSSPNVHISSAILTLEEKKHLNLALDNKSFYRFEISDDGMGFEPGNAEKIFQPFVRLNGKSAFEGTGLGLAMCRRIVENHGGLLYAESEPNKGARFIIILPENL